MKAVKIVEDVYRVGVNLSPDQLFEGIWAIPDGTSINAYIIRGEKTALIDLVDDREDQVYSFNFQLERIGMKPEDIDFVIVNHAEPDHAGHLGSLRSRNPDIQVYCTKKAVPMVESFYGIQGGIHAVKDGETLELGNNKTLQFIETPNIHWPETMMTYLKEEEILFSCDAFGSYGSIEDVAIFDDQLSDEEHAFFDREALRYYANIVASYSQFVERGLKKLEGLPMKMICPSHGIIWRESPETVVERYARFASYHRLPAKPEVTVIWGSMYGNTAKIVKEVIKGIRSEKVPVHQYQVPGDDIGNILADVWKSAGLVLGMPTYEYQMFPPMAHVLDDLRRKKVQYKTVFRFGSYGWSKGAERELQSITEKLNWSFLEGVEWEGNPDEKDRELAFLRGQELARKIKEQAGGS